MVFRLKYFLWTVFLLIVEISIAVYLNQILFIRAYVGDILVVMLIYTFILTFFEIKNKEKLILKIFVFSVFVEVAQYFHIASRLGFAPDSIPYIVMGNYFSWLDIVCYGVGCMLLWIINKLSVLYTNK